MDQRAPRRSSRAQRACGVPRTAPFALVQLTTAAHAQFFGVSGKVLTNADDLAWDDRWQKFERTQGHSFTGGLIVIREWVTLEDDDFIIVN
jgi:hypothetical protein